MSHSGLGSALKAICLGTAMAVLGVPVATADSGSGAAATSDFFTPEEAGAYSKQIERELAAKGARIAIVFRTGRTRDKLPDGIDYTHGAFWVHQTIARPDGSTFKGYVTYNLFHGDGESLSREQSYLAEAFPFEFVASSAVDDLGVILLEPELQRRLLSLLADGSYEDLHDTDYSLIASPFDDRFQNCNEFMLDVIAAALWETTDYDQIKANLRAHFTATRVRVGLLARTFGPLADSRLKTKDHRGQPILTVTFASLADFLTQNGYATEVFKTAPGSVQTG
ncbi:MAG: DUF2145 domain-containing protein [Henriciella sp.]|nr:DUF2145 domain-containing protein [Henriciella sp.]